MLADTERDGHRVAFNEAFKDMKIPHEWDVETYGRLLETGGGKERMTKYFDERPEEEPWKSVSDPEQQESFVRTLHKMKTEKFQKMIENGNLPLREGVAKLVGAVLAACCKVTCMHAMHIAAHARSRDEHSDRRPQCSELQGTRCKP